MGIDWIIVATITATIAAPLAALGVATFLRRPSRVTFYFSHASIHRVPAPPGGQPLEVNTHSLVIQNTGWRPVHNVKLTHFLKPQSFTAYPDVKYRVSDLPGGGQEILFPSLVPKEQVTLSYLYYPPLIWSAIQGDIKSDEGFANNIQVNPIRQYPKWIHVIVGIFFYVGVLSVIGVLYVFAGLLLAP